MSPKTAKTFISTLLAQIAHFRLSHTRSLTLTLVDTERGMDSKVLSSLSTRLLHLPTYPEIGIRPQKPLPATFSYRQLQ